MDFNSGTLWPQLNLSYYSCFQHFKWNEETEKNADQGLVLHFISALNHILRPSVQDVKTQPFFSHLISAVMLGAT